jgi:hypothetical protein
MSDRCNGPDTGIGGLQSLTPFVRWTEIGARAESAPLSPGWAM